METEKKLVTEFIVALFAIVAYLSPTTPDTVQQKLVSIMQRNSFMRTCLFAFIILGLAALICSDFITLENEKTNKLDAIWKASPSYAKQIAAKEILNEASIDCRERVDRLFHNANDAEASEDTRNKLRFELQDAIDRAEEEHLNVTSVKSLMEKLYGNTPLTRDDRHSIYQSLDSQLIILETQLPKQQTQ